MDVEDFVGITTGALIGGATLNVIASLVLGWDSSWLLYLAGAAVGAPIGYRYAEPIWNWQPFWWW